MANINSEKSELYVFQGTSNFFRSGKDGNFIKKLDSLKEKIREFLNLKNVYFFFGCGTSSGAVPTMAELSDSIKFNEEEKEMNEEYSTIMAKTKGNLEACLSILYSARTFFEGHIIDNQQDNQQDNYGEKLRLYKNLIKKIEGHILQKLNVDFNTTEAKNVLKYYQTFYQKLSRRNRDNSRICVFTTNYDLFNEVAMDSLNINYINGFNGGLRRVFNPAVFNYTWSKRMDTSIDKYEPIENLVYLYKIHGSINWRETRDMENTFFEIEEVARPEVNVEGKTVLIYPTPTKQDKSLGSPYVDLFREFQNKLLEPHSVLFVIGYSFSDRHVNDIIYRALATNSSLNVVIFSKKPDEEDKRDKPIFFIDDNRIFTISGDVCKDSEADDSQDTALLPHGEDEGNIANNGIDEVLPIDGEHQDGHKEKKEEHTIVNHFDYIVNELLPNIDAYSKNDEMLKNIIKVLKSGMRQDEDW